MRGTKIRFGIFTALFFACLILGILFIGIAISDADREVPRQIERAFLYYSRPVYPVVREFFEQNREHFDTLARGGLMERDVHVYYRGDWNPDEPLVLTYFESIEGSRQGRWSNLYYYADWGTLEWLSTEEIHALSYLMHNRWFGTVDIRDIDGEPVIFFSPDRGFLPYITSRNWERMPLYIIVEYRP